MTTYFRASGDPNDLTLLPKEQRDHGDLANIAANAEADVIAFFTKRRCHVDALELDAGTALQRFVWLRGYAVDPTDAVAAFTTVFRRAIANVIRWRIARDRKTPNLQYEGGDGGTTAKTYRSDAEEPFPPGWTAPLRGGFMIDSAPLYI